MHSLVVAATCLLVQAPYGQAGDILWQNMSHGAFLAVLCCAVLPVANTK
jgi:hypothetical protein